MMRSFLHFMFRPGFLMDLRMLITLLTKEKSELIAAKYSIHEWARMWNPAVQHWKPVLFICAVRAVVLRCDGDDSDSNSLARCIVCVRSFVFAVKGWVDTINRIPLIC
ncbi:hypothetical protein V6N13_099871 [Hibiscus sabdariffa]